MIFLQFTIRKLEQTILNIILNTEDFDLFVLSLKYIKLQNFEEPKVKEIKIRKCSETFP